MMKRENGGVGGLSILNTRARKAGLAEVPYQGAYSINQLTETISKVYKQFRWLKKEDNQCNTWMAKLIKAQAEAWNKPKQAIWKQLRCTEWIRKMAQNVQVTLQMKMVHQLLLMVEVPGEDQTRQEYHQKVELEKACLEEAGQCFTQAQLTPLLQPPLINIFSETGWPKEITQVLDGSFPTPPECNEYATKFLNAVN